jgi:hypothetical protein
MHVTTENSPAAILGLYTVLESYFGLRNTHHVTFPAIGQYSSLKNEATMSSPNNYENNSIFRAYKLKLGIVGIETGYGLDDQEIGVPVPVGARIFSSPYRPDRLWGPPNFLSNGYRGFSLGVKR